MSRSAILIEQVQRRARAEQTDVQLLEAYVTSKDRAAFSALMDRYEPLVRSVCRRQLTDEHAADDAMQATFVTLIRQAHRVRPAALPAWLVCVGRRISRKARLAESRRKRREATSAKRRSPLSPGDDLSMGEVMAILDEEILQLPSRYQSAFLACYWQGLSQAEAARRQGTTQSALKGLLERGRTKLLARLGRRGLTADVALHGLLIAPLAVALKPSSSRADAAATFRSAAPGKRRRAGSEIQHGSLGDGGRSCHGNDRGTDRGAGRLAAESAERAAEGNRKARCSRRGGQRSIA